MTELVNRIEENAEKEFGRFRSDELLKDKEAIFYDSHKIAFYAEIHAFLTEGDTMSVFDENEIRLISEEGDRFITLLYDYYLDTEYASISNWEAVSDLIRWYCAKYGD